MTVVAPLKFADAIQCSLRRLFYFVLVSCLVTKAVTLLPSSPHYPELYSALVALIFAAIYYEFQRAGYS